MPTTLFVRNVRQALTPTGAAALRTSAAGQAPLPLLTNALLAQQENTRTRRASPHAPRVLINSKLRPLNPRSLLTVSCLAHGGCTRQTLLSAAPAPCIPILQRRDPNSMRAKRWSPTASVYLDTGPPDLGPAKPATSARWASLRTQSATQTVPRVLQEPAPVLQEQPQRLNASAYLGMGVRGPGPRPNASSVQLASSNDHRARATARTALRGLSLSLGPQRARSVLQGNFLG